MKSLKDTKIIVLSLVIFSLTIGCCLIASAASTITLQVMGTVTRDGTPVGAGYGVVITNANKTQYTASATTDANSLYQNGFFDLSNPVAETDDVIEVVVTDPVTAEEATNTGTYSSGTTMTINVDFPAAVPNEGTVTVASAGPPNWTYTLTHVSGSLTEWTYTGKGITGALAPTGWSIGSITATSVTFTTTTAMTSGVKTGFIITGDMAGTGSWVCHDSSGTVDGPLPVVLSSFTARYDAKKFEVALIWLTESELNNLGFDVYRGKSIDGPFTKITPALIKGAGTDSTPHSYKFIDESVGVDNTYYYYLENISFDGTRDRSDIIRVIIDKSGKLNVGLATPEFALLQNFPNPFNPETWIPFRLGQEADVTIRIFDVKGQNIRTIHLGRLSAGFYTTRGKAAFWDGKDTFGESVSSGIYFYNLTAGDLSATKKLTVVK
jgi:hypothetical protein